MKLLFIFPLLCYCFTGSNGKVSGIIQTTFGPVSGVPFTVPGVCGKGHMFRSIPYAAPPVSEKRFAPPEDPKPWKTVYDASEFGPSCPQPQVNFKISMQIPHLDILPAQILPMNEDCLTLDVYTPSLEGSRTVMVLIHGGGLVIGSSRYEGRDLALSQDVVAVSIQYRLGVLGWASTGDGVVPGNLGFMDQVQALKWVQNNIDKFGGNPDDVTIYGESAGAWSVSLHMVSPKSKGLFHRAILMSGSKIEGYGISPPKDMPGQTRSVIENIGCGNLESDDLLICLRNIKDPSEFVKALPTFEAVPVRDQCMFPLDPTHAVNEGKFHDVDVLAGAATNEGYYFIMSDASFVLLPDFNIGEFKNVTKIFLPWEYPFLDSDLIQELTGLLIKEYATGLEGDDLRAAAAEMVGDEIITQQTFKTMDLLKEKSLKNLYFYEWQYRPSIMVRPDYMTVDHADEVFIMGATKSGSILNFPYDGFTEADKQMDDIMLNYWANFAKTGNPNGGGQPTWPSFRDNGAYLKLNLSPSSDKGFKSKRMKFWMKTIPKALGS